MRLEARAAVERGDREPIMMAAIWGPVSVNTVNMFDGLLGYGVWPFHTEQTDWASFNAGELLMPRTRRSLLPLFIIMWALSKWLRVTARRADAALG